MGVDLVKTIVSDSGVSDSLGESARIALGPFGTQMRVTARSMPGNPYPPGPCPAVSIETSENGETWTTLVEPAVADGEGIEARAVYPLGHDLRVRWLFDEPCFATTYFWLRVWLG